MTRINFTLRAAVAALSLGAAAGAQANTITEWNFGTLVAVTPYNTPAPTLGTGSATSLGMTNSYTYTSGATVKGVGSVTGDDVTLDAATATTTGSTLGNGNVWRIRGVAGTGTTGTANNGWNNSAAQYSQGAEFDVATTGYTAIGLTFSWASTTQGIGNLQVQYTTNGSTWTNIGSVLNATVDNGALGTAGYGFQTDTVNFAGVSGTSDNALFGVRLVAAYNPTLGNEYASATSVLAGAPVQYNNNSGNWRIADVQVSGVSAVPLPGTAWLLGSGFVGIAGLLRRRRVSA